MSSITITQSLRAIDLLTIDERTFWRTRELCLLGFRHIVLPGGDDLFRTRLAF
jgi:hypothetical protein